MAGRVALPRSRGLAALLVAETISSLGSQLTALALPWFVLVTTGSPTRMGVVLAVELIPMAVLGIPSGAIISRLGARRVMLVSDLARAPVIALVPVLHAAGGLSFEVLLIIAALHGMFSMTYFSCQRVVLAELSGDDARSATKANALLEGATNTTAFLGPALAGGLIAALGAVNVLWLDAASFALSFVIVALLVRTQGASSPDTERIELWRGIRYLRRDAFIGRAALSSLVYGFVFRILFASLPVLAFQRFAQDPVVAGTLSAAWGAGAVAGSLLALPIVGRVAPLRLATFASIGITLPLWLLVPEIGLAAIAIALFVSSAAIPLVNAPYLGILSTRVPANARGQVLQAILTVNTLAGPLAYAVAGPLVDLFGLREVYTLIAALATVAALNFVVVARTVRSVSV